MEALAILTDVKLVGDKDNKRSLRVTFSLPFKLQNLEYLAENYKGTVNLTIVKGQVSMDEAKELQLAAPEPARKRGRKKKDEEQ